MLLCVYAQKLDRIDGAISAVEFSHVCPVVVCAAVTATQMITQRAPMAMLCDRFSMLDAYGMHIMCRYAFIGMQGNTSH